MRREWIPETVKNARELHSFSAELIIHAPSSSPPTLLFPLYVEFNAGSRDRKSTRLKFTGGKYEFAKERCGADSSPPPLEI